MNWVSPTVFEKERVPGQGTLRSPRPWGLGDAGETSHQLSLNRDSSNWPKKKEKTSLVEHVLYLEFHSVSEMLPLRRTPAVNYIHVHYI